MVLVINIWTVHPASPRISATLGVRDAPIFVEADRFGIARTEVGWRVHAGVTCALELESF